MAVREQDDGVIIDAVIDKAQTIAEDWRKDLAVRIGNEVGEHLRRMF